MIVAAGLFALPSVSMAASDQDRIDVMLKMGRTTYDTLRTYTAVIDRKELLGRKVREQPGLIYRFRKPKTMYVKFTSGSDAGTEAVFDPARFGDDMSVRKRAGGLFVRLKMDPMSPVKLGQERHPIYDSDIGFMLQLIERHVRLVRSTGLGSISFDREERFDGRPTLRFTARFPQDKRFYGSRIIINMDLETGLPVRAEVFGWDGEFLELYEYKQLRLNPPLKEQDFEITGS
jgi:hypothetical protein